MYWLGVVAAVGLITALLVAHHYGLFSREWRAKPWTVGVAVFLIGALLALWPSWPYP